MTLFFLEELIFGVGARWVAWLGGVKMVVGFIAVESLGDDWMFVAHE